MSGSKIVAATAKRPKPPNAGKGRVKGVPNKFTGAIKEMVREALDRAGGVDYLMKQADANPGPFLTLIGKLLPSEISGPNGSPIQLQAHADELSVMSADQRAKVRAAIAGVLEGRG